MILWGRPEWLVALVVPALLLVLELVLRVRQNRARTRFAAAPLWERLAPGRSAALRRLRRYLFLAALVLLVVAIANPRVGTRYEDVTREGLDIVLVVDVSKSMDSQDIRPSRLGKTRYELARFLEGLKGDRVAIVPFAGTAYPLLPLTLDYAAARMFLDVLATDLIPVQGTALGEAITTGLDVFPRESTRGRAMIVVSDGEDHQGEALEAARRADEMGVRIFTVGMARAKGDPIPVYDEQGTRTGWLTEEDGSIVTSRLNEDLLRAVAAETGGSYQRGGSGGDAFTAVYGEIFRMDREEFETRRITGHEDRFQPLLLLAALLLAVQFVIPAGRRRKRTEGLTAGAVLLLALLMGAAAPARADTPHSLVKQGNTAVGNGELDEALARYLQARAELDSTRPELTYDLGGVFARKGDVARADSLLRSLPADADPVLRSRAHYNRGTAFARAGQYEKAVDPLIEALKLNPDDRDAKANLELALRQMQQQQQQQNRQDEKQQQDEERQQEQQQEQDQPQPQQGDEEKEQKPPPTPEEQMDREMAERLLDQMQQDEKELLKEVVRKQIPPSRRKSSKPW